MNLLRILGLAKDPSKPRRCYLCDNRRLTLHTNVREFAYYRCESCGGVVVHPRLTQQEYLKTVTYLTNPEDYISLIDPHGIRWIAEHFDQHYFSKVSDSRGRLLEVGAGVGYFMFIEMARGWVVEGLETSASAAEWASKYLRMKVQTTLVEEFVAETPYDAVVAIETLEHLVDPNVALERIDALLRPGGMLFGTTPNIESDHWKTARDILEPMDHICLFSENSLRGLLSRHKFGQVSIEYFGESDEHLMFSAISVSQVAEKAAESVGG